MRTVPQAMRKINAIKFQLIAKAKAKGLTENFGQKEVRKLRENEMCNPYGTPEQRNIDSLVDGLEQWAMNYEG